MLLYHVSPKVNRSGIDSQGLRIAMDKTAFGALYLSDKRSPALEDSFDCWEVDCEGIPLQEDWTTGQDESEYGKWYMVFEDIPRDKLKLLDISSYD